MATILNHILLFRTNLKYFKSLPTLNNRLIYDRYILAKSMLDEFEEPYRHFLAYPCKEDDYLEFHGIKPIEGNVFVLSDLEGIEAEKYEKIKEDTLNYYEIKIEEYRSIENDKAAFLKLAIANPDNRFIYCYDNQVVMGAWGMKLRDNVRDDITTIRQSVNYKSKVQTEKETEISEELPDELLNYEVRFDAGEHGSMNGKEKILKRKSSVLGKVDIPEIIAERGFKFIGWDENPEGFELTADKVFTAKYETVKMEQPLSWWGRFWNWLRTFFGAPGCLKWFWWLLLLLLLLLLLFWILCNLKSCNTPKGGSSLGHNDSGWLKDDPNVGKGGGIYDPYNPYKPAPTPPEFRDVLPPAQGVLPPLDENPEVIPGNPSVIANRLNILMENQGLSIMDLAKDFKTTYPDERFKVIYYDDVVKRMQIEVPRGDRERLKQEIPLKLAPKYQLFVFDEALFEGAYTPSDPDFGDMDKSWHLKAIHAPEAWDITRGSEKITVAVVDNGFNVKHPELKSKVVQPYNVWSHSADVFAQQVDHGTHVAGIALALADNGKGICGVAPNCKFMPVQVANERGQMTTTSVLDGILYALYQGADVINVSLGSSFTGLSQQSQELQKDLINNHFKEEERLWRHVMRIAASHNSTIVIAAGNDNVLAGIDAIQRPELFITVSALDKNNTAHSRASFSNYGDYSDIAAPGVGIYSTIGVDGYQKLDGTSMAAPIISGSVALMKSINEHLTNKQILCLLQGTGIAAQGNVGNLVQLDKALQKVKSQEVVDCTPIPTTGDVQVLLSWGNYNDLDLIVTDPTGATVWYKNKHVPSGGQLEIDMNFKYPDSRTPIENIYWPQGGAPKGTYNVYLLFFNKHESTVQNAYNIKVKHGSIMDEFSGNISKEHEVVHICSFTLGTDDAGTSDGTSSGATSEVERRRQLEAEQNRLQKELERINRELQQIQKLR